MRPPAPDSSPPLARIPGCATRSTTDCCWSLSGFCCPHTDRAVTAALTPRPATVDLGGQTVRTLAYGATIPAQVIRANVGDELAVAVTNRLDHPTSVHWHGITLRNDMDGTSPAAPNIEVGRDFIYPFSVQDAGTYWAHPHTELDADFSMYAPINVDARANPAPTTPNRLSCLMIGPTASAKRHSRFSTAYTAASPAIPGMPGRPGMGGAPGIPGMSGMGASSLMDGDADDINYRCYLINGRIPAAPTMFTAKAGQRIRMRIINAASDTAFQVAPAEVDALLLPVARRIRDFSRPN